MIYCSYTANGMIKHDYQYNKIKVIYYYFAFSIAIMFSLSIENDF